MAYVLYQVLTRKVAPHDRAETSALWSALPGGVLTTLALPCFWTGPLDLVDAAFFLSLGPLGAATPYFIARALACGPAAVIAPFQYWQIVGSVLFGAAISGFWPDGGTWVGAAVIVSAGIFLAVGEARRR